MLFNNPDIIKSSADIRIGGVEVDSEKIDFDDYMVAVRLRIIRIVVDFVNQQVSSGMTRTEAINEARGLIYNYIHIDDKDFFNEEIDLVDQIMQSQEFVDWKVKVYYRFQDQHHLNVGNPIQVNFGTNSQEVVDIMEEEENMFTILEGLVAQYK